MIKKEGEKKKKKKKKRSKKSQSSLFYVHQAMRIKLVSIRQVLLNFKESLLELSSNYNLNTEKMNAPRVVHNIAPPGQEDKNRIPPQPHTLTGTHKPIRNIVSRMPCTSVFFFVSMHACVCVCRMREGMRGGGGGGGGGG